jgi:hypothetical protein
LAYLAGCLDGIDRSCPELRDSGNSIG